MLTGTPERKEASSGAYLIPVSEDASFRSGVPVSMTKNANYQQTW